MRRKITTTTTQVSWMRLRIASTASVIIALTVLIGASPVNGQDETEPPPTDELASGAAAAAELPSATGPLLPGRYVDSSTGPLLEFTIGDGWQLIGEPIIGVGVDFARADDPDAELIFTRFVGEIYTEPCITRDNAESFQVMTTFVKMDSDGLMGYLGAHPHLVGGTQEPTEIAGLSAQQLDATVEVGEGCSMNLPLWPVAPIFHITSDGNGFRAIAADTDRGVFVAYVTGPADTYPELLELAMEVIESIEVPPAD